MIHQIFISIWRIHHQTEQNDGQVVHSGHSLL